MMTPTMVHIMKMIKIYTAITTELIMFISKKSTYGEMALYERALLYQVAQVSEQIHSDMSQIALGIPPVKKLLPPVEKSEADYPDFEDGKYSIRLSDPSLSMFYIDIYNDPEDIQIKTKRFELFISELKHINQTSP